MLMLEPSNENPLNLEAYSYYVSRNGQFDANCQLSIRGGWISGVLFPDISFPLENEYQDDQQSIATKRNSEYLEEESQTFFSPEKKRRRSNSATSPSLFMSGSPNYTNLNNSREVISHTANHKRSRSNSTIKDMRYNLEACSKLSLNSNHSINIVQSSNFPLQPMNTTTSPYPTNIMSPSFSQIPVPYNVNNQELTKPMSLF